MTWNVRTMIGFVLVCCGAVAIYFLLKPPIFAVPATPEPVLASIPTEQVAAPKTVKVYAKKAKTKLNLPVAVVADDRRQVVTSSRVAPDRNPHTVTTVMNLDTGEFATFERKEPLPWMAKANETALAIGAVLKDSGATWRLKARRDLFQAKALYGYAEAQLDGDREASAGVFLEWRF